MSKLSIVIPVLNQHEMAHAVIDQLFKTISPQDVLNGQVEVIVIDNGSDVPFKDERTWVIRHEKSIGVYPTFEEGFKYANGDIVAFFHSDLVIWGEGWDKDVLAYFEGTPALGMIGFVGSNEIDSLGGRGVGTVSNFRGLYIPLSNKVLAGSSIEAHAYMARSEGFTKAAVVDGCAMIIRKTAWKDIGYRQDFPPHHFYDRLISTQLLEKKWEVGVLGIACDHFSGQTVMHERAYHEMAREWAMGHISPDKWKDDGGQNWDATIYQEAERQWLKEYRDEKHLIPLRV